MNKLTVLLLLLGCILSCAKPYYKPPVVGPDSPERSNYTKIQQKTLRLEI